INFPILNSKNITMFNEFLIKKNITIVIKVHPHQKNLSLFKKQYSNIKILDDSMLDINVDFYNYIPAFDSLITDYSSIIFDYLLLDKPIAFAIEDYDEYLDKRGFT